MMSKSLIQSIEYKQVSVEFEKTGVLHNCDFVFPLNANCRLVFNSDREKFFFYHSISQVEGFVKGEYLLNGLNVADFSFEEFLIFRLKMGFGFSTRGLIHNLTLRQNLELPLRYHNFLPEDEIRDWVEYCGEYFNLGQSLDVRPSDATTSQQKSTLILRAFVHKPELVFLDTPELMLSGQLQANLLQLIDEHRSQYNLRHLYFSTYDEELSDCLADKNIILSKKKLQLVQVKKMKRLSA